MKDTFENIFGSDTIDNMEFDTVFGAEEDGELIDCVGQNLLFTESGDPVATEDEDEQDEFEEATYEELADLNAMHETAKFSIVPRFRQVPELKRFLHVAEDAEEILNNQGENPETGIDKVGQCILRVLDVLLNVEAVLRIPSCLFIIGIPYYLFYRLIEYCTKMGQFAIAKSTAGKIIRTLRQLANETKDAKVKKECEQQIEKVEEALKKLKKNESTDNVAGLTSSDFETMLENDSFVTESEDDDFDTNDDEPDAEEPKKECGDGCPTTSGDFDKVINGDSVVPPYSVGDGFSDDDFSDDDFEDDDFGSEEPLRAFHEKPTCNHESELDSPETTADLDRVMDEPGNARPDDLRDMQHNEEDNSHEVSGEFYAAESTSDFDNKINFEGDEDIAPDSEGALDDDDDIDSVMNS